MLRVGVTGGIGSGKSTVAQRLAELGAVVVDADAVAREVVEPGQPALAQIAERFGSTVILPDGALDRAALAAVVFTDADALAALNGITGPAINARVLALRAATPTGSVSVFDMPLLVDRGLWMHEHVNIAVEAAVETRVARLVEFRGLPEQDARNRVANQATDSERRAACDVVLDNNGTPDQIEAAVDLLWAGRLAPWNDNLVHARRSRRPDTLQLVLRDDWEARGARVVAKLAAALAHQQVTEVSHIGSTSVPGLLAKDVIDVQVGVRNLTAADADDFRAALRHAGYLEGENAGHDTPHPAGADPGAWPKRYYGGTDPAEIVHLHIREHQSLGWRFALLFRDWLRHNADERDAYAAHKQQLAASITSTWAYAEAKEPWFDPAWSRANAWGAKTGWTPR